MKTNTFFILFLLAFSANSRRIRHKRTLASTKYDISDQFLQIVPLFRYHNNEILDHFYTTNFNEIRTTIPQQVGNLNYTFESIAGYVYKTQRAGTIPIFRYLGPQGDHFYTRVQQDYPEYTSENIGFYAYSQDNAEFSKVYRYYEGNKINHFYTINAAEIGLETTQANIDSKAVGRFGYVYQGVEFSVLRRKDYRTVIDAFEADQREDTEVNRNNVQPVNELTNGSQTYYSLNDNEANTQVISNPFNIIVPSVIYTTKLYYYKNADGHYFYTTNFDLIGTVVKG